MISNQQLALYSTIRLAQVMGCAVREPFCHRDTTSQLLFSYLPYLNLSAVIPIAPFQGDPKDPANIPQADFCVSTNKCNFHDRCGLPKGCGRTAPVIDFDQKNATGSLRELGKAIIDRSRTNSTTTSPLIIGLMCPFELSWTEIPGSGRSYSPAEYLLDRAFQFIEKVFRGKSYISAHIRRGDFNYNCSAIKDNDWHPCALDMEKTKTLLVEKLTRENYKGIYIATNADEEEAHQIHHDILSRLPADTPSVQVIVGIKNRVPFDSFQEEVLLEQIILWCAKVYYESPKSSWLATMERVVIRHCKPEEVIKLPIQRF